MVIIPYFSVIDNHRKHVTLNLYLSYVRSNFMTDYEQIGKPAIRVIYEPVSVLP